MKNRVTLFVATMLRRLSWHAFTRADVHRMNGWRVLFRFVARPLYDWYRRAVLRDPCWPAKAVRP